MLNRTIGRRAGKGVAITAPWQAGRAQLPDQSYETLFREGYGKNEIVFACVEEWATDIAEAELRAYRNTPNGPEIVDDHPAVALFNSPSPWMSGDDFCGSLEMYKRMAGNTFILKVRSMARKVIELWVLRPDRVRIVPDVERGIKGYEYLNGGQTIPIPAEDIIHLKTRHPFNDFYGMSPLMAAAGRTDIDNFMKDMVKGSLQNSGVPAGILRVQGQVSDQEKALFRSRFKMDFGGGNAGNVMVHSGGKDSVDYTPLAMPLGARGLVIPELDEMDEARIAMVFRVPQSVLGTRLGMSSSSYGNRESDQKSFTQRQLVPEWQSIASTLTQKLLPDFGGADFLAFDLTTVRALAADMDALSTRILAEVKEGVRSREEGRRALGLMPNAAPGETFEVPVRTTILVSGGKPGELIALPGAVQPPELGVPNVPQLPPGDMTSQPAPTRSLPQVIVINAQAGEVRKIFEYDDEDRIVGVREIPEHV